MTGTARSRTYEEEILDVLRFEHSVEQYGASERKIRRRLREKGLGPYDQARIDALRRLKDDASAELGYPVQSRFHTPGPGRFADWSDWDLPGLLDYMRSRHTDLPTGVVDDFVTWAIDLYYMR